MSRLSVYEFGTKLLETKDLDPVYVLLHHSGINPSKLKRWLLSYWCFYHVGTASWIASTNTDVDYWIRMETAARSKDYPRSSERRHFRGQNAIKSVAYLSGIGVTKLFDDLLGTNDWSPTPSTLNVGTVMDRVQQWVGFGPWIAFKVADMLECLGLARVKFDVEDVFLFDSPREGAGILWQEEGCPELQEGSKIGAWAVSRILQEIQLQKHVKAPPTYSRNIGAQEAETILCKWKSYLNGRYTVGEDIKHCREGLMQYARYSLAQKLLKSGKLGGLW